MTLIERLLVRHEGICLRPYKDSVGKLTIGIGRNLDDVGISEKEAYNLLRADIFKADSGLRNAFEWYSNLNEVRQAVVCSMVFNIGLSRFKGFKKLIAALEVGDYAAAANEMINSKWAEQVKTRAVELSALMVMGEDNAK